MSTDRFIQAAQVASGLDELSAPATVLLEVAVGAAAPVIAASANAAAEVVAGAVSEAVAVAIGEVAGAIPVVGFFVNIVTSILSVAAASSAQRAAEARAECQAEFQRRKVIASGSKLGGCEQCPTDLFRPRGEARERSLVGAALIAVTEGSLIDEDPRERVRVDRRGLDRVIEYERDRYDLISVASGGGVSAARREKYRTLRVAMEQAYTTATGPSTDGGVSLWPAYLDMLLRDVDEGRLNARFVDLALSAVYFPKIANVQTVPSVLDPVYGKRGALALKTPDAACYLPHLREMFFALVAGWRDSVRPRYDDGRRALEEIQQLADRARLAKMVTAMSGRIRMVRRDPTRRVVSLALGGIAAAAIVKPSLAASAGSALRRVAARLGRIG